MPLVLLGKIFTGVAESKHFVRCVLYRGTLERLTTLVLVVDDVASFCDFCGFLRGQPERNLSLLGVLVVGWVLSRETRATSWESPVCNNSDSVGPGLGGVSWTIASV